MIAKKLIQMKTMMKTKLTLAEVHNNNNSNSKQNPEQVYSYNLLRKQQRRMRTMMKMTKTRKFQALTTQQNSVDCK
jgi:hypothetical protein